jgi:hypothetical protein
VELKYTRPKYAIYSRIGLNDFKLHTSHSTLTRKRSPSLTWHYASKKYAAQFIKDAALFIKEWLLVNKL